MIDFTLKFLTTLIFGITMMVNLLFAALMFLPAMMVQAVQSTDGERISWFGFLFSPLGAQVACYILVAADLYLAIKLLPEKWLPNIVDSALSIPLIAIATVCLLSVVLTSMLNGFNIFLVLNILSTVLCLAWATRATQNA